MLGSILSNSLLVGDGSWFDASTDRRRSLAAALSLGVGAGGSKTSTRPSQTQCRRCWPSRGMNLILVVTLLTLAACPWLSQQRFRHQWQAQKQVRRKQSFSSREARQLCCCCSTRCISSSSSSHTRLS